jgi:hypothetical protein
VCVLAIDDRLLIKLRPVFFFARFIPAALREAVRTTSDQETRWKSRLEGWPVKTYIEYQDAPFPFGRENFERKEFWVALGEDASVKGGGQTCGGVHGRVRSDRKRQK